MSGLQSDLRKLQREAEFHTAKYAIKWEPYDPQRIVVMAATIFLVLFGGNQSGKTWTGLHKVRYDVTGEYPDWWEGPRTTRGIEAWVCGDRYTSVRDGIQKKLFGGDLKDPGTQPLGAPPLIPAELIIDWGMAPNGDGALGWVKIRHSSGGVSTITFKTYKQGIEGLASATIDLVHIDEECDFDVLAELVVRVMVNQGQIICTLTPLKGRSRYYKFLSQMDPSIATVAYLHWNQARHLDEGRKAAMASIFAGDPQFQARMSGVAVPMTGICFPYMFEDLLVPQFEIPLNWPRIVGIDQGWSHPTTGVCIVRQPGTPYKYVLPPYIEKERKPMQHHNALMAMFGDAPCAIDWSANQANKDDGEKIIDEFNEAAHGLGFQMRIAEEFRKYRKARTRNWLEGWRAVNDEIREGNLMFIRDDNVAALGKGKRTPMREMIDQLEEMEWEDDGSAAKHRNSLDIFDGLRYGMVSVDWAQPVHVPRPLGRPQMRTINLPEEWSMPRATLS